MSRKKIEIEDYHGLAERRGFKWVGGVLPRYVKDPTWWECERGDRWQARYNDVRRGSGCPICYGRIRKTEIEYHFLATGRGFKWVGGVLPKNNQDPTLWECDKGDRWKTTYSSIQQGSGCPVCSGKARKTKIEYHVLANSRGFKWVGGVLPKSTHTDTLWECGKGDRWSAAYHTISQGSGCPICSGKAEKTEKDYHMLAERRGFRWIGDMFPENIQDPTWWECEKGDRWEAQYNSIQQGGGCPHCLGLARKIEKDYHDLAKIRGFKWVGGELPKNTYTDTLWECDKGHKWETKYSYIQQGSGCQQCKDMINGVPVSKPQRKLNSILHGSLNYPESRYRIDVAIMRKSQKIAVEYDCQYWHEGREEHDVKRDNHLIFRGWKIVHVKSRELLPTRKQIKKAINDVLKQDTNVVNLYLEDWK